jgi:uncharacterized protein involved in exopolysaccharide biosynthesis
MAEYYRTANQRELSQPFMRKIGHDAAGFADVDAESGWEMLRKIWRRKKLIIVIAVVSVLLGALVTAFIAPRYKAEARILLGMQEPKIADIESVLKGITPNSETVQSEAYVIASRNVARQVGERLKLDESPTFNPALRQDSRWLYLLNPAYWIGQISDWFNQSDEKKDTASTVDEAAQRKARHDRLWERIDMRLLSRVEAVPLNRSHVLTIAAEDEDPEMATNIANTFSDVYVQQYQIERQQAIIRANEWLETRIRDLRVKVNESDRAVANYRQENDLYATKSDTVIAQHLSALNQQMIEAANAKTQAATRLAQAESQLGKKNPESNLPSVLQSPLIISLRTSLADLERQAADLSASYTDKHPKMRNINAQIGKVENRIRSEIKRIAGSLRNESKMADNQYAQVSAQLDALKNQYGKSNSKEIKLHALDREAEANRAMLASLLQRSKETMQLANTDVPQAKVISQATIPLSPSFPPSGLILILSLFVGVGGGVFLALLLERLDQTYRTTEEIEEHTGIPALVVLPLVKNRGRVVDYVVREPNSVFANGLRMLNVHLSLGPQGETAPGIVMFTSAAPGEGKSHTSASFAQLMALEGRRTILLDLDWRQPTQHKLFDHRHPSGLVELLDGSITPEEAVYCDPKSGAHVIFMGKNASRLRRYSPPLDRLRLLLYTLSRHYDVIVLDSLPMVIAPEVLHIAQMADHTVVNVKWGSTPKRVVANELRNLMQVGARVSGIALSQVDPWRYDQYSYGDAGYLRHGYLVHDPS